MFEHPKDILQPPTVRDTQTRTIRGGQQPPLPLNEVPPESELTNVMSEEAADASVHIHLSRDDLWSLWESLMQELTSEMSGSELSQGMCTDKLLIFQNIPFSLQNVLLVTVFSLKYFVSLSIL